MFVGPTSLTPPENGADEFSGQKTCQHFPINTSSRVVQFLKFRDFWAPAGQFTCVHPTLVPLGEVCGSNWPTIVGSSNSNYLEQVLSPGADHRLAYSCTRMCGQLLGGSRVRTLLVYVWGGGCGSNWLTLAGLSSSKYLEHMLLPGADHRLACSATRVILGYMYLEGGSCVCTLHLYLCGVGGGSKWLTIVGLFSSKHLEHMLFLGADHKLAYSAT